MRIRQRYEVKDIAIFSACIFALIIKAYKIGTIPVGYNWDEIGSVYDAWCLVHYGVDKWQMSWPVYFLNFGSGQNALYTYMLVPLFAIFGYNPSLIRIPALISSMMLLFGGAGIILGAWEDEWRIFDRKIAALIYIALYAVAPCTQLIGRIGLESHLMLGFSTFSIYLLMLAVENRKAWQYLLSGMFWGLTLYSYALTYLTVPFFLSVVFIALLVHRKLSVRNFFAFVCPLALLAFPLILEQIINIFDLPQMMIGPFTVTRLQTYRSGDITFSNIPYNFFLVFKSILFFDFLDYNTIEQYYLFYPMSIPFFFVGVMKHISLLMEERKKKWNASFMILIWLFAMMGMGCLLGQHNDLYRNPNATRMNGIFFAEMFYIVLGFCFCFRDLRDICWKKIAAGGVTFLYLVFSVHFIHYYFNYFRPLNYWGYIFPDAARIVSESEELSSKPVFSEEAYMYYLASSEKSPYEINFHQENSSYVSGNWRFEVRLEEMQELVLEYGPNASYLIRNLTDEELLYFEENDFEAVSEGPVTFFYHVSEDVTALEEIPDEKTDTE